MSAENIGLPIGTSFVLVLPAQPQKPNHPGPDATRAEIGDSIAPRELRRLLGIGDASSAEQLAAIIAAAEKVSGERMTPAGLRELAKLQREIARLADEEAKALERARTVSVAGYLDAAAERQTGRGT